MWSISKFHYFWERVFVQKKARKTVAKIIGSLREKNVNRQFKALTTVVQADVVETSGRSRRAVKNSWWLVPPTSAMQGQV